MEDTINMNENIRCDVCGNIIDINCQNIKLHNVNDIYRKVLNIYNKSEFNICVMCYLKTFKYKKLPLYKRIINRIFNK